MINIQNIVKSYGKKSGKITILNTASLEIKQGEIIALIGPSGSGKSTLLYAAGLLDSYDSGEVILNDVPTSKLSDSQKSTIRKDLIGFVYQSHNLFPDFSAEENVALSLQIQGIGKAEAIKKARAFLSKMGLSARAKHRPAELSGGEAQRVAIARALVKNPKILFADEPTGNLDPKNSDSVFHELLQMVKGEKMTALIATHNPNLAAKMTRRIALVDGKLYDLDKDKKILQSSAVGKEILTSFH